LHSSEESSGKDAGQRVYWEERAATYQRDPQGVLFQGLPPQLNRLIHQWHSVTIAQHFLSRLPRQANVLDLAAGYGRLSLGMQEARPDLHIHGADLTWRYSQAYAAMIGPALCADLAHPPFRDESWDGILVVTGLMYLDEHQMTMALTRLLATLKRGGLLFCLDPGREFIEIGRQLGMGRGGSMSHGFTRHAYWAHFRRADCTVIARGSNGWFSLMLPLLWLVARAAGDESTAVAHIGHWAEQLEQQLDCFSRWAIHRWLLVQKEG